MRNLLAALCALAFLAACASNAMRAEDVSSIHADCSNVDEKIAILQQEKEENNKRTRAGVQAIVPVSAVYNMVRGDYRHNLSIATGEWAEMVDAKLLELNSLKARCQAKQ